MTMMTSEALISLSFYMETGLVPIWTVRFDPTGLGQPQLLYHNCLTKDIRNPTSSEEECQPNRHEHLDRAAPSTGGQFFATMVGEHSRTRVRTLDTDMRTRLANLPGLGIVLHILDKISPGFQLIQALLAHTPPR